MGFLGGTAAAAKSLQSCPTLCDPRDGSPPGSPVPGILEARTLECVAISFSNAWQWKVKVKSLSRVQLLVTPWTAAYQAPRSMGVPRQEYWSGVPLPSPQVALVVKNSPSNAGDTGDAGWIPESGRSPGGANSSPLQYSCLENPMDRGAWWAMVHGIARVGRDWTSKHRWKPSFYNQSIDINIFILLHHLWVFFCLWRQRERWGSQWGFFLIENNLNMFTDI